MATTQAFGMNTAALTQIWNFQKLKGQEIYQPWTKRMKSALTYNGLWEIVNQGAALFADDLPKDPAATAAHTAAYATALENGKGSNKEASELIYSMCEEKPEEAIWLTRLLSELDIGFGLPTKPVLH